MRKQFASTVEKLIEYDDRLTLLLGDIGVFGFRNSLKNFSNRVYNIGILEQTMIGLAAGLSKTGLIPIVHTIAPFMVERAYEQLKIDFGYQNLRGNFVSIGASYDYAALGPTHHCPADVPILKNIPNFQIVVPGNSKEFEELFNFYYNNDSPTYFRLTDFENITQLSTVPGKGILVKKGTQATVICVGNMLDSVLEALLDVDVTILYYSVISPFDYDCLRYNFNENFIICEPYYLGSLNADISKTFIDKRIRILNIGIPQVFSDRFGTKKENDIFLELDSKSIREKIIKFLND